MPNANAIKKDRTELIKFKQTHLKPYGVQVNQIKDMKKFIVDITRISYGYKKFEVEAETLEDAEELALELALNEVFDDHDADYKVEETIEIK